MSELPSQIARQRIVIGTCDTGMDLLIEAADALEAASSACEAPEDVTHLSSLAGRIRNYLAVSRPTTALGMPRIPSNGNRLAHERIIHRSGAEQPSHVHILSDGT